MIAHLTGTILEILPNSLIIDVNGVGYEVFTSTALLQSFTLGKKANISIATIVKEDSFELFGFANYDERRLFNLLLTVSGIGPRTALAILGQGVASITRAVATADVLFFTSIPRIGKKNAQKIIIELKSKLGDIEALDLSDENIGKNQDLLDALISMGFSRADVIQVIKQEIKSGDSIETNIRKALKVLGKQHKS